MTLWYVVECMLNVALVHTLIKAPKDAVLVYAIYGFMVLERIRWIYDGRVDPCSWFVCGTLITGAIVKAQAACEP